MSLPFDIGWFGGKTLSFVKISRFKRWLKQPSRRFSDPKCRFPIKNSLNLRVWILSKVLRRFLLLEFQVCLTDFSIVQLLEFNFSGSTFWVRTPSQVTLDGFFCLKLQIVKFNFQSAFSLNFQNDQKANLLNCPVLFNFGWVATIRYFIRIRLLVIENSLWIFVWNLHRGYSYLRIVRTFVRFSLSCSPVYQLASSAHSTRIAPLAPNRDSHDLRRNQWTEIFKN